MTERPEDKRVVVRKKIANMGVGGGSRKFEV